MAAMSARLDCIVMSLRLFLTFCDPRAALRLAGTPNEEKR
jgi:hypothetical protein